jgi:hypothetical protein
MQEPRVGDKFQFEDKNIEYTIIKVISYSEPGEFSNKLYQGGYQIKYKNLNDRTEDGMKCGIKYDEEFGCFVNYYATKKNIAKRLIIFTHKS